MNFPEIVVGIDGSPASRAALHWAANEAGHRHGFLTVLHAYEWRVAGGSMAVSGQYAQAARERAESIVSAAIDDVRILAPDLKVSGEAVLGHPGTTLVTASARASLTVVGSRGHGGFASLLLGSVSQQVATHAVGPVVVVRGKAEIASGPVVVGVDGSESARAALDAAFAEAAVRGCAVRPVRAFTLATTTWGYAVPTYMEEREVRLASERQALDDDLAAWRQRYPEIEVEPVVVEGAAAQVLNDVSATAQLVVVGTRGHGGFTGLLLGSVGLQLLHHADSPVLIARPMGSTVATEVAATS